MHNQSISTNESGPLTPKQAAFLHALREPTSPTYNEPSASYRAVYSVKADASDASVAVQASKLMASPKIRAILQGATEQAVQAVVFDRVEVMRQLVDLANADPTAVVMHRRICCRHCHGITHKYQWRNHEEYWEAVAAAMQRNAMRDKRRAKVRNPDDIEPDEDLPNDEGGYGWRRPAKPHPDCPECFGEGEADVFIPDFDTLSPRDRRLIAGVKQTKDGMEVKMRDQDGALTTIAQILKMLVNKSEVSGPDGGPIPLAGVMAVLPVDANQAAQAYQRLMEGGK